MSFSATRPDSAQAYLDASGGSAARSAKSQIYASENSSPVGRRASAVPAGEGSPTVLARESAVASAPINNMGENWYGSDSGVEEVVLTDSGEIKQVMIRRPGHDQACIIDWVNFTVSEQTWNRTAREMFISDEQYVTEASRQLEKIFGFGVTTQRATGMNFYKHSWVLGDDMGFVCFGGQRGTMLVTLTGQGCTNALKGWEKRLYDFLKNDAIRPVISRLDLAHDDFSGAYFSVDWAEAQWHEGGYSFAKGGTPPSIERIGNWHRPRGKGRTLTIGARTSGKFCRFYEKGKKEGDRLSLWCRCEVEFKSSDRIIPFDALLNPTQYFAGAYPCFENFVQLATPQRLELKEKTAQVVIESSIETTRKQFGKYLRVFRELYGDKEALDKVCNPNKDAWPKRLKPLTATAYTGECAIHLKPAIPTFTHFISTVPSFGLNSDNGFSRAMS
jgi:phage replication initiation protein